MDSFVMITVVQAETLNEQLGAAQKRHEAAEAAATPEERVIMNAAKRKEAQQLQKQEVCLLYSTHSSKRSSLAAIPDSH